MYLSLTLRQGPMYSSFAVILAIQPSTTLLRYTIDVFPISWIRRWKKYQNAIKHTKYEKIMLMRYPLCKGYFLSRKYWGIQPKRRQFSFCYHIYRREVWCGFCNICWGIQFPYCCSAMIRKNVKFINV
jgi:hypothetical protein